MTTCWAGCLSRLSGLFVCAVGIALISIAICRPSLSALIYQLDERRLDFCNIKLLGRLSMSPDDCQ
jgi:hypothetical protein